MKKRTRNLLITLLAVSSTACLFAACNEETAEKLPAVKEYDWSYNPEFLDECDADMTIDGVLDETRWEGQDWLTHTQGAVSVKYTTIFTEKGLYIGAVADDPDIQWNKRFNFGYYDSNLGNANEPTNNSAFWFRISATDEADFHTFTGFNFFVDVKDRASRNQTRFAAETSLNGELGVADRMTAELFVTWEALCLDDDIPEGQSYPDSVRILPAYRYVREVNDGENDWIRPTFSELRTDRLFCNPVFAPSGYKNMDVEGGALGNALNGASKSDGWDLSNLTSENPTVTSTYAHSQAIFFKNIYSDSYSYTATVKLMEETWGTGGAGAGLIDFVDPNEFVSLYAYADVLQKQQVTIGLFGNLFDLGKGSGRYSDQQCITLPFEEKFLTEGIEFTVFKNGSMMYYFAENQLVYAGDFSILKGASVPGMLTYSRQAEFSDFSAVDYAGEETEFLAALNEYAYTVEVDNEGGAITPDSLAVQVGADGKGAHDLTLAIRPTVGYVLTSLTIEGTTEDDDYYQYALANMQNGTLKIDGSTIDGNVKITANFTNIRRGETRDDAVRIIGSITSEKDGSNVLGATITVKGDDNRMYYVSQSNNGSYSFYVFRAGTHTVENATIETEGKYEITIEADGYWSKTIAVEVPADQSATVTTNVVLEVANYMKLDEDRNTVSYYGPDPASGKPQWYYFEGSGTSVYLDTTITTDAIVGTQQGTEGVIIKVGDVERRVLFANSGVYIFTEQDGLFNNGQAALENLYANSGLTDLDGTYAIYQALGTFGQYFKAGTTEVEKTNETPYGTWYGTSSQFRSWGDISNCNRVVYAISDGYLYISMGQDEGTLCAYLKLDLRCLFGKDAITSETTYEIGYASAGIRHMSHNGQAGGDNDAIKNPDYEYETHAILFGDEAAESVAKQLALFTQPDLDDYPDGLMSEDETTNTVTYDGPTGGIAPGTSQWYYFDGSGKSVYLNTLIVTDATTTSQGLEGVILKVGSVERRVLFANDGVYVFTEKDGKRDGSVSGTEADKYIESGIAALDGTYSIYQTLGKFGSYFVAGSVETVNSKQTPYGTWYNTWNTAGTSSTGCWGNIGTRNVIYAINDGYLYIAMADTGAYLKLDLRCLFGVNAITSETTYQIGYASAGMHYGNDNAQTGSKVLNPTYSYTTNSILYGADATIAVSDFIAKYFESSGMKKNTDGTIVNDGTLDGSSNYWYLTGSGKSVYLNTDIVTDGFQTRSGGNTQGTDGIIIKVGDTVRRVLFAGSGVYVFTEEDGAYDSSKTGAAQYKNSGLTDANGNYAIYQSMNTFGKYFDTSVVQKTAMETPYGKWYGDAGKYSYGRLNNTTETGNVSTNVTYIIDGENLYIALDGAAYVSLDLDCLFYGKLTADTVFEVGYASSGNKYGGSNTNQGAQTEVWYSYKTNSLLFGDEATASITETLKLFTSGTN